MKWTRLFLFLIPHLLYASSDFYLKDYNKAVEKISAEWKKHEELAQRFTHLGPDEKTQSINFLQESIDCCQRALNKCNYILDAIGQKSHKARKEWVKEKNQIQQYKDNIIAEIAHLQTAINHSKATALYQECEKKAKLAALKIQNCPPLHLSNVEEVVFTFNEISQLYEEAASLAKDVLTLLSSHLDEETKNGLRQAMEYYQAAAQAYKQEAIYTNEFKSGEFGKENETDF